MEKSKKYKVTHETIYFLIFWFGQAVSQLGSSMTGYALMIWAYRQTGTAMSVSLMTFCSYLPRILMSSIAGGVVDRYSKKAIILISDSAAAVCTLGVIWCVWQGNFSMTVLYLVNVVLGISGAFQYPASAVAMGMLVPDGQYERASGLKSFSGNLITVASPMLAGALMAFGGLELILVIDLVSFLFAAGTLMILVPLKEEVKTQHEKKLGMFEGFVDGIEFLKKERGLLYLMLSMALINFCSRLTYENILAPMILARSGNNTAYGIVSAVLGIGGMIGGVLVTVGKGKRDSLKMIYLSAAFSFFFGDLLLGCGRHVAIWCIAGLAASVPIPFIMAGQNAVIYRNVPKIMQGRIFAVQSIVQYSSIPVGILLGGALADYVFEPFMVSEHVLALMLQKITGSGAGSGMAVMFLCTGMLGFVSSLIGYRNRHIREICRRG